MKLRLDLPILIALVAGFLLLAVNSVWMGPYIYDEADYMYAASLGVLANSTDTPTLPVAEFLRLGLTRGRQAGQDLALSNQIRSANDVLFYRHHHGPLYYYWLIGTSRNGTTNEHAMRLLTWTFHILTFLVIYFGCLWVLPGAQGRWAAVFCSLLYFWSFANIRTASEIAPHSLFVLSYVCALLLLAKMRETGDQAYWYAAVAATALDFCTLEISLMLIVTLLACVFLERHRMFAGWKWPDWSRFAARSLALFLGVVLLVWPAALLKLSFVKAYLFMAHLAVFRKNPWGNITFLDTWRLRFAASPVEWGLIILSLVCFLRWRRQLKAARVPVLFLALAALMLLASLRVNTEVPRYMSPFFPALQLFTGFILAALIPRLRAPNRYALSAVVSVLLFWNALRQFQNNPPPTTYREAALLQCVRDHGLTDKNLLVNKRDVPILHYYFPQIRLTPYLNEADVSALASREDFDGVLYNGDQIGYNAIRKP